MTIELLVLLLWKQVTRAVSVVAMETSAELCVVAMETGDELLVLLL